MLGGVALANNTSPIDVGYMHFTYNGKVHAPEFYSPNAGLDAMSPYDYEFLVSCHFDTGGVDVAFLIDSSGSMMSAIADVKMTIGGFADSLDASGFDYRLGACPFADSTEHMWDFDRTTPHPIYEMTDSVSWFQDTLLGCNASGGADAPEEYLDACAAVMRFYDWRLLAMRLIIGFTDAVFCEEGNPCANCHGNEDKDDIITELLDGGFVLFNVTRSSPYGSGGCVPIAPYHINWYHLSADTTGGMWFDLSTVDWEDIFAEIVEFIRDYQSIKVAIINSDADTIFNVYGEFLAGPCFELLEYPDTVEFIAPGDTVIFEWLFAPFDTLAGCILDTTADFCFMTVFHSTNGIGVPNPEFITGGCVYFGEDCGCDGTLASKDFPPDWAITTCPDQYMDYSMWARCEIDTGSFIFKINRGTGWVMYDWADPNIVHYSDTGFTWFPSDPLLFFEHGDTVHHELYMLEDISGLGLHDLPSGVFVVDLEPPVYDTPFPEDGALIGGPPSTVSINVFDDLAGVDSDNFFMTVNGDTILPSDPYLTYTGSSIELDVSGPHVARFPAGDTAFVCVGAQDAPDLCDPNVSDTCWFFIIDHLSFGLPERVVAPGEFVDIPIIAFNPQRFSLDSFEISIKYDADILVFTEVTHTGSALPTGWTISFDTTTTRGIVTVKGNGTADLLEVDTLVMLRATPHPDAPGASYTTLLFDEPDAITLDGGTIGYEILFEGWVLVEWLPEVWTHDLVFDSDLRPINTTLTFGIMPGASDMYDPGLDIQTVPPPSNRTEVFFPIDDPLYPVIERLSRDIRAADPIPITWQIVTAGEPGELTWTTYNLPDGVITLNGMFEMHHHDSYLYDADETLTIVYDRPSPAMADIELAAGWNLIGLPSVPTVPIVPNVFPDAFYEIYGYNSATYTYFGTNSAEAGRGYWVFNNAEDEYSVGGVPVSSYEFPLEPGWNLVGCTNLVSADYYADPPIAVLYGWDPVSGYVSASMIEAGKGYWALSSGYGTLRVPGSRSARIDPPDWKVDLSFAGESFAFGSGDFSNSKGIPPAGPDGEFESVGALLWDRYDMWESYTPDADSWVFRADKDGRLTWDISDAPLLEVTVNGVITPLEEGGSIILRKGDYATFNIRKPLPNDYAVYVKPNPANAAFTVTVENPKKGEVKIGLYDILGHRVDRIASGELTAGTHSFGWRAKNHPSGLYLVRVDWGEGTAVKRVVLLK